MLHHHPERRPLPQAAPTRASGMRRRAMALALPLVLGCVLTSTLPNSGRAEAPASPAMPGDDGFVDRVEDLPRETLATDPTPTANGEIEGEADAARRTHLEAAARAALVTRSQPDGTAPTKADAPAMAAELGGEDELVFEPLNTPYLSLDIASDGTIFVTTGLGIGADLIEVHRSTDGGETFQLWATWDDPSTQAQFAEDVLLVEGNQDRLYVAYRMGLRIKVAWVDIHAASPTWTAVNALDVSGVDFSQATLTTDADEFSGYYLYLAARGADGNGDDIWFTRSLDQGASWQTAYRAVSYSATDAAYYYNPELDYGNGGYLHLGYQFGGTGFDPAVFHRRASGYADAGAASWSAQTVLDDTSNGVFPWLNDVEASLADGTVLFYMWEPRSTPEGSALLRWSSDAGASWAPTDQARPRMVITYDVPVDLNPVDGSVWLMGANDLDGHPPLETQIQRTSVGQLDKIESPESWAIQDWTIYNHRMDIARDPTRGDRRAVVWELYHDGTHEIYFDAEWRRDPGRPNPEVGFPVSVSGAGSTPPAIAEIDGDPYLEIVFGTSGGGIHVLNHDGTYVSGFPVELGVNLPLDAPVAVGDLNGDGRPTIVTGTTDGRVFALEPDGTPTPGWPVDLGSGSSAFVTIGALGPPYPRCVVAASGQVLRALKYDGGNVSPAWGSPVNPLNFGVAIGDVDGDGVGEIVVAQSSDWIRVQQLDQDEAESFRFFPGVEFSDRPTLGDIDLDGDLEIVIPARDGKVRVLHHDLSDYSTDFPYDTGVATSINSVSIVNLLGNSAPELVFAQGNGDVHIVFANGSSGINYPKSTGGAIYTPTAVGNVLAPSPDVVVSSVTGVYCWENLGAVPTGWPREIGTITEQTPAIGDIDLDGRNEVVVLSLDAVRVFDVGSPPSPAPTWEWPMAGYDAQRTGCLDCAEDLTTAVDDPRALPSRVALRAPHPNPMSSQAFFRYALPSQARVSLRVFDVRGRLVHTLVDGLESAGVHELMWDGRNHQGREVAQGVYLARLIVEGSGGTIQRSQKVTVVR